MKVSKTFLRSIHHFSKLLTSILMSSMVLEAEGWGAGSAAETGPRDMLASCWSITAVRGFSG